MNKKLFLMLVAMSMICLYDQTVQTKEPSLKPCQCFCAFKGDLRDKTEKDTPFIATLTNSKGKTFNICLCAKRDLEHLKQNPSLIDLITDDIIAGANCCDQLSKCSR